MATSRITTFRLPTTIPDCQLWLDATDIRTVTLSGSNVTQILDKSGRGNHTTSISNAVYTNTGLNNLPCFSNVTNITGPITSPGTTSLTVFVVGSVPSFSGTYYSALALNSNTLAQAASSYYTSGNMFVSYYGGQNPPIIYGFIGGGNMALNYQGAFGQPMIWEGQQSGSSTFTWGNGTQYNNSSVSATNLSYTAYWLGGPWTGSAGGPPWPGYLGEVLVYNRTISTAERQQVEGYLAWKWGTNTGLPSTHPYKSASPVGTPASIRSLPFLNSAVFSPPSIAGCQLWLDAADASSVITSAGKVSQWNDKSGNGRNATQGTSSQQPTYSNTSVSFTKANSNVLALPNGTVPSGNSAYSIFFNLTPQSAGIDVILFSGNAVTNEANGVFYGAGNQFQNYWFGVDITGGTFASGTRTLIEFLYTQNVSRTIYQNGASQITAAASNRNSGTGNNYIGAEVLRGFYSSCDIQEIIIYNTALTTTQRQQVEGYLAWKWGLVATLPAGHPYKIPPIAPFPSGIITRFLQRSWLPTLISGCSLWLDGADPTGTGIVPSNGTALATWADKSGSSRSATQSTGGLQPTYTSRYINFSGAQYFNMTDAFNMLSSVGRFYSFFVVERRGSANTTQFLFGGGGSPNSAGILLGYNTNTVFRQTTASNVDLDVTVPGWANPDPTRMWSGGYSGSIRETYLNSSLAGTQAYSTAVAGWTQPVIGFLPYFSLNTYYTGQINEILFYNSFLTTNQRQQVEGYLAWKWGLQGNLPITQPFKYAPPPPQ
jgi:hypothetical protein